MGQRGRVFVVGESITYGACEPVLIEKIYNRVSAVENVPARVDKWRWRFARHARPSWIGQHREIPALGVFPVCQFRRCKLSGGISSANRDSHRSQFNCNLHLYKCRGVENQEGILKLAATWVGFLLVWLPSRGADWQMQASRVPSWHELWSSMNVKAGVDLMVALKLGTVALHFPLKSSRNCQLHLRGC